MLSFIVTGFLSGFINGFFGAGGGVIALLALNRRMEKKEAHATTVAVVLAFCVVSLFFYGRHGVITWRIALSAGLGGLPGGLLGAHLLKKAPPRILGRLFGALMLVSAWRMLC